MFTFSPVLHCYSICQNTWPPHFTSVDQFQTDSEGQDGSVQCLWCLHTDVRQQDADHICQTGEKTQFLPPEKHPPYPWHLLARQSVLHRGPVPSQPSKHVHPAQTAQAALAGACLPHGGWPHPKRLYGELASRRRSKGRPQLRYKDVCKRDMKALDINTKSWKDLAANRMMWRSNTSRQKVLEGPCSQPHDVEKHSEPTPQDRGKEAGECRSSEKGLQKGAQLQQTRDHTQMRLLRQRLFLPHRSIRDAATIEQTGKPGCTPMIKLDQQRPYRVEMLTFSPVLHGYSIFSYSSHFWTTNCFLVKYGRNAFLTLSLCLNSKGLKKIHTTFCIKETMATKSFRKHVLPACSQDHQPL